MLQASRKGSNAQVSTLVRLLTAFVLSALLAVAVWTLYRFAALKLWHGLVCILFGFYLASSSVAPEIRSTVTSVIRALTGHG